MCLVINNIYHKKAIFGMYRPIVLDDDYVVYKVLKHFGDYVYTPFQLEQLNFVNGVESLHKIPFRKNIKKEIKSTGYHAFIKKDDADMLSVFFNLRYFSSNDGSDVHYAVIPKGTRVYFGCEGDVVAERIIIFDKYQTMLDHYNPHRFLEHWVSHFQLGMKKV